MSFWNVLQVSLLASAVALLLLFAKWLFREHLTARWHAFLWVLLLARMLLPAGTQVLRNEISLMGAFDVPAVAGFAEAAVVNHFSDAPLDAQPVVQAAPGVYQTLHLAPQALPDWLTRLDRILFWGYLAAACALMAYFVFCALRLRLAVRRYAAAPEPLCRQVRELQSRYGWEERVRVRIAPSGGTPYVCGALRPVLVVPAPLAGGIDEKVLLHELAHVHWNDIAAGYVFTAFRCLHWFNPFLWWVFGRISDDSEMACDERVLGLLDPPEHKAYGHVLLSMVQQGFRYRLGTSCIANGGGNIRRRIVRIARHKEISPKARGVGVLLFFLLAVMCLTGSAAVAAHWRGAGVPGGDVKAALRAAERYRPADVNEALYLYGKAYTLDNGYYRYIVADDGTRDALKRVFAENRSAGRLPWGFGSTVPDTLLRAVFAPGEAVELTAAQRAEMTVPAAFSVNNVVRRGQEYTATLAYPGTDGQAGPAQRAVHRYPYDRVRAYRQDGRWVVQSLAQGEREAPVDFSPRYGGDALLTYTASDGAFEYQILLSSHAQYEFYSFCPGKGVWQEQQDPLAAQMFGGSGVRLVGGGGLYSGIMRVRPLDGKTVPEGLGVACSTEPLTEDDMPPAPGTGGSGGGGPGSIRWQHSLSAFPVCAMVERDGWYEAQGDSLGFCLQLWEGDPPERFYMRTEWRGRLTDCAFAVTGIGGGV